MQLDEILKGRVHSNDGMDGEKGNGLGLAICFDFANRLSGHLTVTSDQGKGTSFKLILPK